MTAEPAPEQRVVVLKRSDRPGWWSVGYWDALVGVHVRTPALLEGGRVLAGYLVGARETEEIIELTFADLAAEE